MPNKRYQGFIVPLFVIFIFSVAWQATALEIQEVQKAGKEDKAKESCFTPEARELAEQTAKVWQEPDPDYDPVLGHSSTKGPRVGAPPVDADGLAKPVNCVANKDPNKGTGTTPKFHCSVQGVVDENGDLIRYKVKPHFKGQAREKRNGEIYGEFLSSRFSKALGFFADDEWVADVNCPDCEKSLTSGFQGAPFSAAQPAPGIELSLGSGIDVKCDNKDTAPLAESLRKLQSSSSAEIDAFKLWLAFIDHGDSKTNNHKFACLDSQKNSDGSRISSLVKLYITSATWARPLATRAPVRTRRGFASGRRGRPDCR